MITLLIATRNAHKVGEIRAILGEQFRCLTLDDVPGAPTVTEDAATFAGNASKKAIELARWLATVHSPQSTVHSPQSAVHSPSSSFVIRHSSFVIPHSLLFVLADDSGLEVDALGGQPGAHSARFAAVESGRLGNCSSAENNAKLLRLLKDVPAERRTARFRCLLALTPVVPQEPQTALPVCQANELELLTELFEGVCEGRIISSLRGQGGFGYDPLFVPAGCDRTFGELGEGSKNRLSHRARALEKLKQWFARRA